MSAAHIHIEKLDPGDRKALREFVSFPDRLYRNCPCYVPALHSDQIHSLTASPSLDYCTHALWLARDEKGKVVGRISAFVNPRYNERYSKKCCRFGWFDLTDDFEVAEALLGTASEWAAGQGMSRIHGPLYYNTLGKQGMLVEGFDKVPQFNTLYNFPYYPQFLERLGFTKECDWIQYRMFGSELPERLGRLASILMSKYNLHFADVNAFKKDHEKAMDFVRSYSDIFSRSVYNFIPFTRAEMEEEVRQSISMLRGDCCSIVMDEEDKVAAFGINFPSISKALQKARGSLFPFGWAHILKALHGDNDTIDMMITGAVDKWNGKGLSAVLHYDVTRKFKGTAARYFITNPQIETNSAVNVWDSYDKKELYCRRRCYIKDL